MNRRQFIKIALLSIPAVPFILSKLSEDKPLENIVSNPDTSQKVIIESVDQHGKHRIEEIVLNGTEPVETDIAFNDVTNIHFPSSNPVVWEGDIWV